MKKVFFILVTLFTICLTMSSCVDMPAPQQSTQVAKSAAQQKLSLNKDLTDSEASRLISVETNAYGKEQLVTEASQANFNKVQPPTTLSWSLERDNVDKRNQRWNNPNKISYIYLLSDTGLPIGYFTIKGKVSSVNSKLTTNMQIINHNDWLGHGHGYMNATAAVESPAMDGSYGTNGDAVFFFLTDGTYMEWSGKYLLCDRYVKLTQKPVLSMDVKDMVTK